MSSQLIRFAIVVLVLVSTVGCGARSRKARERAAAAAEAAAKAKAAAGETKLPPKTVTLPAGTRFSVRVMLPPQMRSVPKDGNFEGELAAPISAFAETIVPRSTAVVAVLSSEGGELMIRATKFKFADGKVVDLASDSPRLGPVANQATLGGEMMSVNAPVALEETLVGFRLKEPLQVTIQP